LGMIKIGEKGKTTTLLNERALLLLR
jgi:hypothetical protein